MSYYVLSSYSEFLNLRCTCISTWSSRRQVRVQVRVPRAKYKYKYKYSPFKYKYEYKYSGFVLEYNSSTSTSTKYYISGLFTEVYTDQFQTKYKREQRCQTRSPSATFFSESQGPAAELKGPGPFRPSVIRAILSSNATHAPMTSV